MSLRALNGFDVDLSTANGRMMVTLLSEVAEFAADLLAERVRSGLTRSEQGQNSWPQER